MIALTSLVFAVATQTSGQYKVTGGLLGATGVKNKPVLFVALLSTCPHAQKNGPLLDKLRSALKGKVEVVGLVSDVNGGVAQMSNARKKLKTNLPLYRFDQSQTLGMTHSLDFAFVEQGVFKGNIQGLSKANVIAMLRKSSSPKAEDWVKAVSFLPTDRVSGCSVLR
jgi:hypothetical protein